LVHRFDHGPERPGDVHLGHLVVGRHDPIRRSCAGPQLRQVVRRGDDLLGVRTLGPVAQHLGVTHNHVQLVAEVVTQNPVEHFEPLFSPFPLGDVLDDRDSSAGPVRRFHDVSGRVDPAQVTVRSTDAILEGVAVVKGSPF
jgi:hypothetical protein